MEIAAAMMSDHQTREQTFFFFSPFFLHFAEELDSFPSFV